VSAPSTQDSGQQETRLLPPLGARLKEQRQKRGITLDEISKSTKIGTRFLEAVEEDQFDRLPGGIFNKAFIRAYARSIGADEEQAVADYLAIAAANQPSSESVDEVSLPEPPVEVSRPRGPAFPWGAFATLLLVLAFIFSVWGFFSRVITREKEPTPQPSSQSSASSQTQPSSDGTAHGVSSPAATTPNASPTTPANSNSPQTVRREIVLHIKARENSTLSIIIDGEVTSEQALAASAEKTIHATSQIVIRSANLGSLDFEFQGKQVSPLGEPGSPTSVVFDANGWHAATPSPQTPR
jgi:cytoskeleton protein RodZ